MFTSESKVTDGNIFDFYNLKNLDLFLSLYFFKEVLVLNIFECEPSAGLVISALTSQMRGSGYNQYTMRIPTLHNRKAT